MAKTTISSLNMIVCSWTICVVNMPFIYREIPYTKQHISKYETNPSILEYSGVSAFMSCQMWWKNFGGTKESATVFLMNDLRSSCSQYWICKPRVCTFLSKSWQKWWIDSLFLTASFNLMTIFSAPCMFHCDKITSSRVVIAQLQALLCPHLQNILLSHPLLFTTYLFSW